MQDKDRDMFREAIEKARKFSSWDRLAPQQKAELIAKYLSGQFAGASVGKP